MYRFNLMGDLSSRVMTPLWSSSCRERNAANAEDRGSCLNGDIDDFILVLRGTQKKKKVACLDRSPGPTRLTSRE